MIYIDNMDDSPQNALKTIFHRLLIIFLEVYFLDKAYFQFYNKYQSGTFVTTLSSIF